MLMQGHDDQTRLIVCDLLAWVLQKEPKKRPQSCEEMLRHPFFSTGVKSLESLVNGLHLSRMHIASALGNAGEVQSILAKIDAGQESAEQELGAGELLHRYPLHLACAGGHVNVVKTLIRRKDVDRDALDGAGRTALVVVQDILSDDVGGNASFKANLQEVRSLLAQKLTLAQSADEVRSLVDDGEDPNAKDKAGNTPLHHHASSLIDSSVPIVEALLDVGALVNAQNKRGKTVLHLVQAPGMARVLLAAGGNAFEIADEEGRSAFEAQTPKIRDFILNETLFCGRFEVASFRPKNPAKPEHATDTSVVLRSTDKFPGTDETDGTKQPRDVVLKLMKHKKQFDNEIEQRNGLDPTFILKVIYKSTDGNLASKWMSELPPEYRDYQYGIVMPAAERNLMVVLLQERVDLALAKTMFASFARALGHLHKKGLIQGDFKPGNVVRMPDGSWILIDLDGAVKIGAPIGAKALSTAFMPPEATHVQGDEVVFRVPKEGAPYMPLAAHPTLDLWSFTVVLFRVIAHKPLLEADDRDNLRSKHEKMTLAMWGAKALSKALADASLALLAEGVSVVDRLVVCNLLGWSLQCDPAKRPQSSKDMLAHPFFADAASDKATAGAAEEAKEVEMIRGEEETKDATERPTEVQVNSLALRLKITTKIHIAAELGGPLSLFDEPETSAADLASRHHCLGKTPLHLATEGAHHEAVAAIVAATKARGMPSVHLNLRDLLGDAPIHSLLKAIEAAATSDEGTASLDALLLTLEVLGAEADLNVVDGQGRTAFAIGMMSSSPAVRKLVKDFKMMSKFDPLVRIDVTLDELNKVVISDAIKREVFNSVATQAATVCRHHGEWHGSVFALLGTDVKLDEVTKGIKVDNPLVEGILAEKHSFLDLHDGKLTDQMLSDLHDIMVSHVFAVRPCSSPLLASRASS